ncbi:MAG: hypothetical protein GC186_02325 [Rhodobacteraceae bacterium]|nr:hypothetical protein [Paracoccaceae bacterium]
MNAGWCGLMAVLAGGMAAATDAPPLGYFAGAYRVAGQDAAGKPISGTASIAEHGTTAGSLSLRLCPGGSGRLQVRDRVEEPQSLTGTLNGGQVLCLFTSNADNYPVLSCRGPGPLLLVFWPDPQGDGCH